MNNLENLIKIQQKINIKYNREPNVTPFILRYINHLNELFKENKYSNIECDNIAIYKVRAYYTKKYGYKK